MMIDSNKKAQERRVGIYIHVPFCRSKCHYCDFCSRSRVGEAQRRRYVERLCAEMEFIAQRIREDGKTVPKADTVYFGGGTPTLLEAEQFESILSAVSKSFGICKNAEITAEANPKTADFCKLAKMRAMGINRLSIGMQSVHDNELKKLGRIHDFAEFRDIFNDARRAGFDNISVDLMYGIPDQTVQSFEESVDVLAQLSPEHISSYCLTVEDGTRFAARRDKLILPDEDAILKMYMSMGRILKKHGYKKYEISNFAHKGRESKHNIKYWGSKDYLGFGAAAHSCFEGVRYAHSRDIDAYIDGDNTYCDVQRIEGDEAVNEFVMLAMRLKRGINIEEFEARFGVDFNERFGKTFAKYAPRFVSLSDKKCAFTDKGMFVSNFILCDALDFGADIV